jgi:ATP-binding protein involved in chromosome partitioning
MSLTDRIREAAGSVRDPELRRNLGELGMIGEVAENNGHATVEVRLTIVGCPAAVTIENDVRASVAAVPGITEVTADMQVMTPEQRDELLSNLRPNKKENPYGPGTLTRVIAVTSGKGGVGKSSITANLAAALAKDGYRVGILDADVYGFSIPALMGLVTNGVAAKPTRLDDMIVPPVGHDVKVISIGMFVENANAAVAWRGPMLQRTINQFLTDVYFGDLDFLLLDLPPGTGDVAITVGQLLPNSEVLVVTTGQSAASEVAVRAGVLAQQTGQKIIGVVENMGALTLPDGSVLELFGSGGADTVARDLDTTVLGRIPLSPTWREAGDAGTPVVLSNPTDPAAQALIALANSIAVSADSLVGKSLL